MPAAARLEIQFVGFACADRSALSGFLRQQAFQRRPCANCPRRHYGRQPVVTTREMHQLTRT
jgi:hypothetical protein